MSFTATGFLSVEHLCDVVEREIHIIDVRPTDLHLCDIIASIRAKTSNKCIHHLV